MLACRWPTVALLILLLCIRTIHAEDTLPKKEGSGDETVVQYKIGSHTYMEDGELSDESSGLWGVFSGVHLNKSVMVGISLTFTKYKQVSFEDLRPIMEEKSVNTLLGLGRWRFRAEHRFQPYADIGLGSTKVIGSDEYKVAFSIGLGAQYKFGDNWGIALESRGLSWSSQRSKGNPEASNETTLSYVRFVR